MADLSTVKNRSKLKPRREPYWHRIGAGQFLGWRILAAGSEGTWLARSRDHGSGKQRYHPLGDFIHLPPGERFTAASAEAREWFGHVDAGGSHKATTVRQACERYAAENPDAAKRFPRYVYNDPIANVPLRKLTRQHVLDWRKRLHDLPALVSRSKKGEATTRPRAASTLNRDMVPFRAALNLALQKGDALSDRAWQQALEPAEATGRRTNYLTPDQRRELLKHMPPDAQTFAKGLCLLPLRPSALAKLRVADFDSRNRELLIEHDKAGKGRKIFLPVETAEFLKEQTRSKFPTAHLFMRAGGRPWNKDSWKVPFKNAAKAANLPAGTTAYTLRHSTITDLVQGGLDLLSVGQVSGTGVGMIEKHYGHLQRKNSEKALAGLTL